MDNMTYAQEFLQDNPDIEVLEAFVIDVNGVPRGKWIPRERALDVLTKGMAIDWGKHGIQVNGIGPGYFRTELNKALAADPVFSGWLLNRTPLGRWGEVEDLQGAAVFLSSAASDFVSGHILYVDGGVTAQL